MSKRHCKFFARGACFKGEQCEYSHDRKDPSVDICRFYQKGLCAYGSRCRYKHAKASEAQSSENVHHSLDPDSAVAQTTRGASSWIPKLSPSDKHENSLKCKHQDYQRNGDAGESSTALPSEHLFCTFSASNCPFGEKCSWVHGDQCVYCRKFCLHPTEPKKREEHLQTCEKNETYLKTLNYSREIECNICLEHVLSKPKAAECKFGVLPECDHAFCLSCIRNWRNSAPTSVMNVNNTVRTCPVCRKLSYYVVPSTIWYSTKEEKQEIIDSYKTNCKLIDCKHFDFGNGNCPFGTNCFYKHTVKPGSYTWIHHRPPPPPRRPNNINLLNQSDSISQDSEFFNDIDPLEMMPLSEWLNGSGQSDSDVSDEEIDPFNLSVIPEALDSYSDTIGSEELDPFEIMPSTGRLGGSGWFDPEDFDDEEMGIMPSSGRLGGSGWSAPEDSDDEEIGIMPSSETLNDSGLSDPEDSGDEEMDIFNADTIPEVLDAGSDAFCSEESDNEEWNPVEPSWFSMILYSFGRRFQFQ